ncbi:hypothetical protein AGMMS50276_04960 [Synergistales bacterium]|nr:hypothetical protein AGMMS50276_04960 [Synergistales bacterium]
MVMETAERGAAIERERGVFTDNLIPERVFNSEMKRVDSTLVGIEKTLDKIGARLDKMEAKIEGVRSELSADIKEVRFGLSDKFDERFDKVNARVDRVEALLWGILSTVVVSIIAQIALRYVEG